MATKPTTKSKTGALSKSGPVAATGEIKRRRTAAETKKVPAKVIELPTAKVVDTGNPPHEASFVESSPKAKKASKAPVAKRDTSIKTWTLTAVEVRKAVAEIKERMGDDARGALVTIGTRTVTHVATTKAEAYSIPEHDDLAAHYSVEKGTSLPEVRAHGYVAHIYVGKGDELAIWTVWLSPAGPVLLTRDGKRVK